MVRSTTKTKGKGTDGTHGTTAKIELAVSRVVIQSPRSASKTGKTTKTGKAANLSKTTKSSKTIAKPNRKKRT